MCSLHASYDHHDSKYLHASREKLPCTFILHVASTSGVSYGPEPSHSGPALTFSSCMSLPIPRPTLSRSSHALHALKSQGVVNRVQLYAHDDHYLTHSKFNSFLTEVITPQITSQT